MCFFYVVGTVMLWRSDCEEWKCLIRRAPVVSYAVGTELRFKLNEQLDQRSVSVLLFRAGAQTQTPEKKSLRSVFELAPVRLWFCWQTHQGHCSMCKNSIRGLNVPSNVISFMLLEAAKQWQTHQGCILNHPLHISRTCSFVGSECTSNDEPQLLRSIPLINLLIWDFRILMTGLGHSWSLLFILLFQKTFLQSNHQPHLYCW